MPRGRPRKPRLTRMDAAVDAMAPYGFTEKQVKKAVKGLLEVYDGNDAWPFIEESSYILLIDTILSEVERIDQEEGAEDGNNVKDKPFDEGTSTGVSSRVSNIEQDEETEEIAPADVFKLSDEPAETAWPEEVGSSSRINYEGKDEVLPAGGSGKDWKGILPDQTENKTVNISRKNDGDSEAGLHPTISNPIQALPSLIPSSLPPRRRRPCYGWIESDEEEEPNDFIYLNQAPAMVESTATTSTQNRGSSRGGSKSEKTEVEAGLNQREN